MNHQKQKKSKERSKEWYMRYIQNKHHSGILKSNLEIKILIVSGLNMPIKSRNFHTW